MIDLAFKLEGECDAQANLDDPISREAFIGFPVQTHLAIGPLLECMPPGSEVVFRRDRA